MTEPILPEPELRFAFEARVDIAPTLHVGRGAGEVVAFTPITGGVVDGPRLQGEVLASGGDWSVTRDDATELDARYLLRASDGSLIDIVNRGFWRAASDVEARLSHGEAVAESEYYFRTSPVFRTDAAAHSWLCSTVFVGLARDTGSQICIRFFELL